GSVVRLEQVACCLCGTSDSELIATVRDWRYGLARDAFVIVRCRSCGLAYLNLRPVRQDMERFYPGRYYERWQSTGAVFLWARRLSEAALVEQVALCGSSSFDVGTSTLLDVGCASGTFFSYMRDRGWRVQGVEISLTAVEWGIREH